MLSHEGVFVFIFSSTQLNMHPLLYRLASGVQNSKIPVRVLWWRPVTDSKRRVNAGDPPVGHPGELTGPTWEPTVLFRAFDSARGSGRFQAYYSPANVLTARGRWTPRPFSRAPNQARPFALALHLAKRPSSQPQAVPVYICSFTITLQLLFHCTKKKNNSTFNFIGSTFFGDPSPFWVWRQISLKSLYPLFRNMVYDLFYNDSWHILCPVP